MLLSKIRDPLVRKCRPEDMRQKPEFSCKTTAVPLRFEARARSVPGLYSNHRSTNCRFAGFPVVGTGSAGKSGKVQSHPVERAIAGHNAAGIGPIFSIINL